MSDPFFIQGPALISFSGGRTSAYMLHRIIEAHGGELPADLHCVFANTGKEREETLRFVHECGSRWGVRIRWIEWISRKGPWEDRFQEVGFNSAARNGEPFAGLIEAKKYLPNSQMRFCTDELKVKTLKAFMISLGYKKWTNIVGLRADEPGRAERSMARSDQKKERWENRLPLFDAGISKADIWKFWLGENANPKEPEHPLPQGFDLGLWPFEGNCDGCFLKGRAKLREVERYAPGSLHWWSKLEQRASEISSKKSGAQFRPEYSYAEIIDAERRNPDLFAGAFDAEDMEQDAECGLWCAG